MTGLEMDMSASNTNLWHALGVSEVRDAALADLDPVTLYRILALRSAVFVVEQACVYLDTDGRDLDASARQLWIERDGDVVATLRILRDADTAEWRIGRVATASDARNFGLAAHLMRRALEICSEGEVVLNAQSYLRDWYGRFGFGQDGDEFDEDGIPHIPMRLAR